MVKLYKNYTKEPFSFLVNDTTLSLGNPLRFRKKLLAKKSKQLITKLKKNKVQYKLYKKTAKILA